MERLNAKNDDEDDDHDDDDDDNDGDEHYHHLPDSSGNISCNLHTFRCGTRPVCR